MALWRFIKQMVPEQLPYSLVFKNMGGLPTEGLGRKVYSLQGEAVLSYTELRERFAAAVLFPHDVGMISFDDLYALGIPLLLPEDDLVAAMALAHLVSTDNYPWYLLREEHADVSFARAQPHGAPPWDPGWGGAAVLRNSTGFAAYMGHGHHNMELIREAVRTANFGLFPHVRRFASLSGLLAGLADFDAAGHSFSDTAAEMRRFAEEAWQTTSQFYVRAASYLLGDQGHDVHQ